MWSFGVLVCVHVRVPVVAEGPPPLRAVPPQVRKLEACQSWVLAVALGVKTLVFIVVLGYLGYLRGLYTRATVVRARARARWRSVCVC